MKLIHDLKENIKARLNAERFDIYKEQVVENGNDGYFIYNGKIYYGDRLGVFFYSNQNTWYREKMLYKSKSKEVTE